MANIPIIKTYNAKIIKIKQETSSVKTYTINLNGEIDFFPGQFVMAELKKILPGTKRAYSISSSPLEKKTITITIKAVGLFSNEMAKRKEGDEITILGPIGHFMIKPEMKEDFVFMAAGCGITPFLGMIDYTLKKMENKINLFYSSKTPDEFIFLNEFDAFAKNKQFKAVYTATRCTDPNWKGYCERINPEMIKKELPDYKKKLYFLCGPLPFVEGLTETLKGIGVDEKNIKVEKWGTG